MTGGAQSTHSCEASFLVRCITGTGHLIWMLTEGQLLRKLKWRYRPKAEVRSEKIDSCSTATTTSTTLFLTDF